MNHVQPMDHSFLWLVIAASMMLWSGCSLRKPLQSEFFGSIEWRKPAAHYDHVVVGVPRGSTSPAAAEYAIALSAATGAGLVIDRGSSPVSSFSTVLRSVAAGPVEFYVGVDVAIGHAALANIDVTVTGLTAEQIAALKASYIRISARESMPNDMPPVGIAVQTVDELLWRKADIERRSLMALVARGLDVRLPERLSAGPMKHAYEKILSFWIAEVIDLVRRNPNGLATMKVAVLDYGKIESIAGKPEAGLAVGAPHGTFDIYTAGMVRQICARGGFPGVIARGFTPIETGGWRINVNRPTERYVVSDEREFDTTRARQVYRQFAASVLAAAGGELDFYIDVHQNTGHRIEVATVALSREAALFIKKTFVTLRDAALAERPDIAPVDLAIEPVDELEVGAWAAKTSGILTLAKQSLHFEIPSYGVMSSAQQRNFYTPILAELIAKVILHLRPAR